MRHEPTGFVGRAAELAAVGQAVALARVITLTGPGGVGKTRIALRAAQQLSVDFPDGVTVAELSGLRDAEFLPHTVASATGLPEIVAQSAMDQLIEYFADKRALLVLDTCEHLVDAVAMFADILVHSSARLVLLLTSRQPVALAGEYVLPVGPLPEPDPEATESTSDVVALFAARARAACPSFVVSDDNRAEVVALCRRVDCMPLAIELAAVRLRTLSLEQILRRLDDRFQLLTGVRSAQARHQTLRATIEWSHDLCSPHEQELWARLSVFAGGFTLAAVEEVCFGDELDGADVIDVLLALVDKSVVQRADGVEEDRYRMLDTLREYGAERLQRSGRTDDYARRHLDFFLRMATRAGQEWLGDDQVRWGERLAADLDNFRAAMDCAVARPGDEAALRLVNGLWGLWLGKSRLTEARRWTDKALAAEQEVTAEYGKALWHGCMYGLLQADTAARELVGRCRAVAEQLDDDFLRARTALMEAFDTALWGDTDEALALYEQAREQLAAADDLFLLAAGRPDTAAIHATRGDHARALQEVEQGLRALEHIPQERWVRNYLLIMQVLCLWAAGEPDRSRELGQSVLPSIVEQGETMELAAVMEYLSWVACTKGEHALGTVLLGGAGALWRKVGTLLWSQRGLTRLHNDIERTLMLSLGAERFTEMYAQGARLSVEELVDVASGRSRGPKGAEDGSPLGPLTARERQVARLIAEGLANRQIAERLVISKRTADAHVEHILSKLGFSSRNQVAAMVAGLKEK
ncbi:LuxR C-terminal-related transcriptional regulator [Streptomyces sp. NPDC000151]|uniref:ATP-binding protein n=1 Tax=Streptomyces sp. NPDC000151 TaxID=3154244 RepID=UPI00331E1739